MSWELPLLTSLILSFLGSWWIFLSISNSIYVRAAAVILVPLASWLGPWTLFRRIYRGGFEELGDISLDALFTTRLSMVLTLGAVVWLLHRSWQTLWKPVPELINILGVDVPEPPDVSLAGIRSNAATLSWTRPPNNRQVQRYLIQVNGIHVGETPGNEIAITVTGLKPNHFYNIRVVAIGANNFQAASQTIRLRTFGKDGKPYLGNARVPTNFVSDDQSRARTGDENNSSEGGTPFAASVEAAPVLDGNLSPASHTATTVPGQRRNTINRRHSPSVASQDQPSTKQPDTVNPEASLDELNVLFQGIRKEIIDTQALLATEDLESQQHEDELKKERDARKASLKDKEEQTAILKTSIRTTMEQMRAAEKERMKKEQQLSEKEAKKSKVRDNITKLEKDMAKMKKECEAFQTQRLTLKNQRDLDVSELDNQNNKLQDEHNELEADLSNKGKMLNEMKEAQKHLAEVDDESHREKDEKHRREWEQIRSNLDHQLLIETKNTHHLDHVYHSLMEQMNHLQQQAAFFSSHQDTSTGDFEQSANGHPKRLSNESNLVRLSPQDQFVLPEPTSHAPPGLSHANFTGAPLFLPESVNHNQMDDDMKSIGGPLSPSAQAYLPSGIIDFDGPDPKAPSTPLLPESVTAGEEDDQSPTSSAQSYSVFSSPHGSTHHLPFPQYQDNNDQASLDGSSAPAPPPASGHRLTSLLSGFQRNRKPVISDEGGPPIGSLRSGQSQSFPRGNDESDMPGSRRRLSFSFKGHRNSSGPEGGLNQVLGSGSKSLSRRLNPFAASSGNAAFDRDAENSRPPSIASVDFPRPSTDSGSIWGAPGDVAGGRLWSPESRWPSSRAGSRRPSVHGSPSALTTSLASAEDEILYETELHDPQTFASQVGVIGSRPLRNKTSMSDSLNQRLNPNAPTFKGLFSKNKDKDKESERSKERSRDSKGKGKELAPFTTMDSRTPGSPSDPRRSRDTLSVHTQISVSASHESLTLDGLEHSNSLPKESDNMNGIRKLLRKGSSGKFSLSSRLGKDSSLFKKGPGSTATNSDRNATTETLSSMGDGDDLGDDLELLGRSYESMTSNPSLTPSKFKESKEGRMSNWRFMKKNRGKEVTATHGRETDGMEMDRPTDEE